MTLYLINVVFTDDFHYWHNVTVGVATDEKNALRILEEAQDKYEAFEVFIDEVKSDEMFKYC